MVFGVGLFDDFHRLGPKVKFLFQIIGASVAFWGIDGVARLSRYRAQSTGCKGDWLVAGSFFT